MAIIYTYPDLGAVDGSEKLLVSDGNDLNNTKTVTTAAYGAYINATYGGGSGTSIYKADGSIVANRQLSGQSLYSLTLASLTSFTVGTSGAINLGAGGDINVDSTDIAFSNTNGIKSLPNPTNNKIYWDANQILWVKSHRSLALTSAISGVYVGNSAAEYLEIIFKSLVEDVYAQVPRHLRRQYNDFVRVAERFGDAQPGDGAFPL